MKRILLILAVVALLPVTLLAQGSRQMLLGSDGTLFSIESTTPDMTVETNSLTVLKLNVEWEGNTSEILVPASLEGGANFDPSLAFDGESNTLFIFWVRMLNAMGSELLFTSYHDGQWAQTTSLDGFQQVWRYRSNLAIEVTRWARELVTEEDGTVVETRVPRLGIHATWWEQDGTGEFARYAVLTVDDATVTQVERYEPLQLLGDYDTTPALLSEGYNFDLFRHPSIQPLPSDDGVRLLFADWSTSLFHEIDLVPIVENGVLTIPIGFQPQPGLEVPRQAEGVLTIPIGATPGRTIGPPANFQAMSTTISAVQGGPGHDSVILYYEEAGRIRYFRFDGEAWGEARTIPLGERINRESAVQMLERLSNGR